MNHQPSASRSHSPHRSSAAARIVPIRFDTALPIAARLKDIVTAIRANQVIIIAGETGSGKTTQLPLMCLEAGRGYRGIACTQPRRIAATSIARHVASQINCEPGSFIGHRVRFDQKVGPQTVVTFMTDGMLLTDIQRDRELQRYDTIIIDEAHERSLNIDFLLGYLRRLVTRRPDLKIIISSATIDTELFSKAFGNAPVLEVSGRMFPVELIYRPLELDEDGLAEHYIDASVRTTVELLESSDHGDILVFMPTQQDIAETVETLTGRMQQSDTVVLPLYGRMPSNQQNRIFERRRERAVIVATNIAETSITVTGIRFVVDTGLARTVRYVPSSRTSRMPVEQVSQASANQRSGRCGRVQNGTCVRLYSREDFESRPRFTTPEIRRTNLAGAILQLHYLGLGPMDSFPFLEPPEPRAIGDGYAMLAELGALSRERELTPLGTRMAQLPLDPPISRMILQSAGEHALREIKIIAAGLSVVDPRERPQDKQALADAAHKRFMDPMSDFLLYLKLWDTYQGEWETLKTQNRMRAFCKRHFLSYNRMREWHDVHRQIEEISGRFSDLRNNTSPASYDQIHRSLCAGLLHNLAMHTEKGIYRAARDREAFVFPGSSLFRAGHPWIICHEIVETSRVYCRTAAIVQPEWIEQLAPHLCRSSYAAPHFDPQSGYVRATEQVTFFGLPIVRGRGVLYSRVNPEDAQKIFIQQALVEGKLQTHLRFLAHNVDIRAKVERLESKLRTRTLYAGDEAAEKFYDQRLAGIASAADLERLVRSHKSDSFLKMDITDLLTTSTPPPENLPDRLDIGGHTFPLSYRFAPGESDDGICVTVPQTQFASLHRTAFEWALPALWPSRIQSLLDFLPKGLRKEFVPLPQTSTKIASRLTYSAVPFQDEVRRVAKELTGKRIPPNAWDDYVPGSDIWVRVRVVDSDGNVRAQFVSPGYPAFETIPTTTADGKFPAHPGAENKTGITRWDFGDLNERVATPSPKGGMPLFSHPALKDSGSDVSIVMCPSPAEAVTTHRQGLEKLFELTLAEDLAWEEGDVRVSTHAALTFSPYMKKTELEQSLRLLLRQHHCEAAEPLCRTQSGFLHESVIKREALRGEGLRISRTIDTVAKILGDIQLTVRTKRSTAKGKSTEILTIIEEDIESYIRRLYENHLSLSTFIQYPRYMNTLKKRVECAFDDPAKFRQRRRQVHEFETMVQHFESENANPQLLRQAQEMVEEYAISIFAQQAVGTRYPVSEKRIRALFDQLSESSRSKH